MKKCLLLLFLLINTCIIYAQSDYYVKGDALIMGGITIIDQGEENNTKNCKIQLSDSVQTFTPDEISEYGFNSLKYFSKTININGTLQKYFLLRLNNKAPFVYYFHGHKYTSFFIEKEENTLTELTGENYRRVIEDYTAHCQANKEKLKSLSYSRPAFERYFSSSDYCKTKHIAYFKWGILAGIETSQLSLKSSPSNTQLESFSYSPSQDALIGIFADYPFGKGNFSVHPELSIAKNRYSSSAKSENNDYDLVVNLTSVSVPVLLRYTTSFSTIFPFINAGLVYSNNIRNKGYLSTAKINSSTKVIELSRLNSDQFISSNQLGIAFGAGFEYRLNYKRSLSVEFRYTIRSGLSSANDFLSNYAQLLLSVNI